MITIVSIEPVWQHSPNGIIMYVLNVWKVVILAGRVVIMLVGKVLMICLAKVWKCTICLFCKYTIKFCGRPVSMMSLFKDNFKFYTTIFFWMTLLLKYFRKELMFHLNRYLTSILKMRTWNYYYHWIVAIGHVLVKCKLPITLRW